MCEKVVSSAAVMFSACECVCVYLRGGLLMFSSVVLSLVLQQETATEILRSQGTIGFQKEEEEEEGKLQ